MEVSTGEAIIIGLVALPSIVAHGYIIRGVWNWWQDQESLHPLRRMRRFMSSSRDADRD